MDQTETGDAADLTGALHAVVAAADSVSDRFGTAPTVVADFDRHLRKGVPEVIFTSGKRPADSLVAARQFLERTGRAILSRVDDGLLELLRTEFPSDQLEFHEASRMVILRRADWTSPSTGGRAAVITAGTSDVPVAEEAAVLMAEMGCTVQFFCDVGVAGLHRLAQPLREILAARADVVIVAAGMDGALPSVVAGLIDVPVIGLPTSVGYGAGGHGQAALLSMLQTCSPGLSVVNIDNGIGAGATAGLIANRVASARAGLLDMNRH